MNLQRTVNSVLSVCLSPGDNFSKCYIPETVPLEWHFHFEALERERVPADLQRKLQ
jgi:hypothetical protein